MPVLTATGSWLFDFQTRMGAARSACRGMGGSFGNMLGLIAQHIGLLSLRCYTHTMSLL